MVRKMTRDTRIDPKVSVVGQRRPLGEECEDEIVRIVQESLTNTIKHANASRFENKLIFEPHRTQLQILIRPHTPLRWVWVDRYERKGQPHRWRTENNERARQRLRD